MTKFLGAVALVALTPLTAIAQTAPSAEEMAVSVNWGNLQNAIVALMQHDKQSAAEVVALKQHQADLDAYLKACGDRPGCTSPVAETK